jgi:hypothetical protein
MSMAFIIIGMVRFSDMSPVGLSAGGPLSRLGDGECARRHDGRYWQVVGACAWLLSLCDCLSLSFYFCLLTILSIFFLSNYFCFECIWPAAVSPSVGASHGSFVGPKYAMFGAPAVAATSPASVHAAAMALLWRKSVEATGANFGGL